MQQDRGVEQSLKEYARGVAGGLIFSLPLLYTMEMWEIGASTEQWRLLLYTAAMLLLLIGYNRYAGLRSDAAWGEVVIDTIEEIGIGIVISTIVLWMLGRINADTILTGEIGMIVYEAMMVAVGVSVGTSQLGADNNVSDNSGNTTDDEDGGMEHQAQVKAPGALGGLVVAICGAVLFAANIAPTEELKLIATEIQPYQQLLLVLVSLATSGLILYYIEFVGSKRLRKTRSRIRVLRGAITTYAMAVVASAGLLAIFTMLAEGGPAVIVSQVTALAAVGALGASAGRLIIQ